MCDTLGALTSQGAFFAKNSDRHPNEPQVLEWAPARKPQNSRLRVSGMEIEQVPETLGCLLSRPDWLWGAEMGVNECGVAIGNEAVFSKAPATKPALLGMDLVRLGLERSETAYGALEVLIGLLERYGQGGNCGYEGEFYYDNAFLIMDATELFVLETAAKRWVYRRLSRASISNVYAIRADGDVYGGGACDFAAAHQDERKADSLGGADRRALTQDSLRNETVDAAHMISALRRHAPDCGNPFAKATCQSVCMHAGNGRSQTTASMVADLRRGLVFVTGCSLPCVSLFKPVKLGYISHPVHAEGDGRSREYWIARETWNRALLNRRLPDAYYAERDALETEWIRKAQAQHADPAAMQILGQSAARKEAAFFAKWAGKAVACGETSGAFASFWADVSERLGKARGDV